MFPEDDELFEKLLGDWGRPPELLLWFLSFLSLWAFSRFSWELERTWGLTYDLHFLIEFVEVGLGRMSTRCGLSTYSLGLARCRCGESILTMALGGGWGGTTGEDDGGTAAGTCILGTGCPEKTTFVPVPMGLDAWREGVCVGGWWTVCVVGVGITSGGVEEVEGEDTGTAFPGPGRENVRRGGRAGGDSCGGGVGMRRRGLRLRVGASSPTNPFGVEAG
jgi:hypothetical protein